MVPRGGYGVRYMNSVDLEALAHGVAEFKELLGIAHDESNDDQILHLADLIRAHRILDEMNNG